MLAGLIGPGDSMRGKASHIAIGICFAVALSREALAQESAADILNTLSFHQGTVQLDDNLATVNLKPNFRYLNNADTQTFLSKIWGNPPGAAKNALGMLLPTTVSPVSPEAYGVIISYHAIGYVSDDDAEKIDYATLLREMQEGTREESKRRVANGHDAIELIGWARQPYYDKDAKKLYWAKQLRFGNAPPDTLNYNIRILGRRGVLNLNVVAGMDALPTIDQQNAELLSMVSFNSGNLYKEFNPSIDKTAAVGIAGLIAGGVLTKSGFFKGLIALLFASKKVGAIAIFAFFAALWGGLKAIFRRRRAAAA